jgi:hypothetical protein
MLQAAITKVSKLHIGTPLGEGVLFSPIILIDPFERNLRTFFLGIALRVGNEVATVTRRSSKLTVDLFPSTVPPLYRHGTDGLKPFLEELLTVTRWGIGANIDSEVRVSEGRDEVNVGHGNLQRMYVNLLKFQNGDWEGLILRLFGVLALPLPEGCLLKLLNRGRGGHFPSDTSPNGLAGGAKGQFFNHHGLHKFLLWERGYCSLLLYLSEHGGGT